MAHEISRTANAFFNAGARELGLGRICPFEFDDGVQRELPEQTLLHHFSGTDYEWLFMGSFWDRMQTAPNHTGAYAWEPRQMDHPWVKALTTIVQCTIQLMAQETLPDNIKFCIHIYYDAHVPLMCAVEDLRDSQVRSTFHKYMPKTTSVLHEGALPDVIVMQLQCSFWNENKQKMKPIVHLMCKALPQRCQIRNLREIISNYCQTDDLVHSFMRDALLCSLLGMYSHCKKRLSWDARKQIIRRFIYAKPNRMQMQEWLFTMYQHLLFYIIKEFLTFSMHMIPCLHDELCKTYKWNIFETTVRTAMDSIRETVQKNVLRSTSIQDWLSQIESTLMQVNKQQLGNLYRPQRQSFTQNAISICERIDEQRREVNPHIALPKDHRALLREMAKRVPRGEIHIEWLRYFNVKQSSIDALINMYQNFQQNTYRAELRKLLSNSNRRDFETIREFFVAFQQTHHDVRVFALPQHYYEKQCEALRRRYEIEPGAVLPPHVGKTYVCISCNTFKGFTVKRNGKSSNLFANGHHKIIIDDETLKCYCGRRCEKTDTKKRKRIAVDSFLDGVELDEQRKRREKKDWKTRRKIMQNDLCASTECVEFNMTGCLLQFYDHLYLFCPSCGNPTMFDHSQYDKHGLSCGECMKEGTLYTSVSCYICKARRGKDSWTSVTTVDESGQSQNLPICNSCYKPWLKQCDQPVPIKLIHEQREKKQSRRTNPNK